MPLCLNWKKVLNAEVTELAGGQRFIGEFIIDSVSIAMTVVWLSGKKRSWCSCGIQIVSLSSTFSTGIPAMRAYASISGG